MKSRALGFHCSKFIKGDDDADNHGDDDYEEDDLDVTQGVRRVNVCK